MTTVDPAEPFVPGRDIATVMLPDGAMTLQPRDLGQAMDLSKHIAVSGLVPDALRGKPADILLIMMYGMEMGLPVVQALSAIHVIKGRPALSAELRVAKTRERGHLTGVVCKHCSEWANHPIHGVPTDQDPGRHVYAADWDAARCTYKAQRRDTGEVAVVTWTIEDAKLAGLVKTDSNWVKFPKDMLLSRASARACRLIAPEVAYGIYTEEEARNIEEPTVVEATLGEPVAEQAPDPEEARRQAAAMQDDYTGPTSPREGGHDHAGVDA